MTNDLVIVTKLISPHDVLDYLKEMLQWRQSSYTIDMVEFRTIGMKVNISISMSTGRDSYELTIAAPVSALKLSVRDFAQDYVFKAFEAFEHQSTRQ